jgi:transposase
MQVLRNYPTPDKIVTAGAEKIEGTWKSTMKRTAGIKRAQELVKVAGTSIGRKTGLVAAEASLQNLLSEYDLYSQQYQQLEQLMLELLQQVPHAEKLLDIKGVGLITAATFVGEVGDIERFQDPRQIHQLFYCSLNSFLVKGFENIINRI